MCAHWGEGMRAMHKSEELEEQMMRSSQRERCFKFTCKQYSHYAMCPPVA